MRGMEGVLSDERDAASAAAEPSQRGALLAGFDAHHDRLYGYLARRLGPDAAEDLVAETFAIAYARWHAFDRERGELAPWLFGIAANLLRRQRRQEARRWRAYARVGVDRLTDRTPEIDERLDASTTVRELASALAAMSGRDREVLLLFAWADLRYEEIAAALGIPVGTVRSRLNRARHTLRNHLADREEGR